MTVTSASRIDSFETSSVFVVVISVVVVVVVVIVVIVEGVVVVRTVVVVLWKVGDNGSRLVFIESGAATTGRTVGCI